MEDEKQVKKAGRPREFDLDLALDTALHVFWRKGYEGTSLSDLTDAVGVSRPSLYAAFGSKEDLFRRVLDRYTARYDPVMSAALAAPTARRCAEVLLTAYAQPRSDAAVAGCLLVQGALACSDDAAPVRAELAARREAVVTALRARFESAQAGGDLPPDARPADLARYVVTVMNGLSVQAAGGASAEDLRRVAEIALAAWPE